MAFEKSDANTRAVFGGYISIYNIQGAVRDNATVPIYYESRISEFSRNAAELPKHDAEFEEISEGEELTKKENLNTKWAALEALVGDPKRIALGAADMVSQQGGAGVRLNLRFSRVQDGCFLETLKNCHAANAAS